MHPDVIVMDDLVSERNVKTDDQINKTKEYYKFSLSLLEPGGLQLVIGTRYHKADLYGDLIDIKALDTIIRPAYLPNGGLYFPSRLTIEFLEAQRKEQGSYIFNSQYMLEPLNDESSTFKQENFRYYNKLPNIMNKYILIDPAITVKKRSDFSVIIVVGEDADKNFYVIEYKRIKVLPKALINEIFKTVSVHKQRLRVTGIETVSGFKLLLYNIKDEMKRRGVYFKLTELKTGGVPKEDRITSALEPLFFNGFIYFKHTHVELEKELLDFPYGEHDDIIDALSYIVAVTRPGASRKYSKPQEYKPASKITGY
jgi:predicted phage terminase large subunit-like protein